MIADAAFDALPTAEQEKRLTRVAETALTAWADDWRPRRLIKYRENAVFEIADGTGRRAVLRVHRPGYHSDSALRSELTWMTALAAVGVSLPCPIPAADGAVLATVETGDVPHRRQVDVFEWLDGHAVAEIADPALLVDTYRQIGALAGAIHRHAANWQPPADFDRHAWDRDGLIGAEPLWGNFRDLAAIGAKDRALLERAIDLADRDLARIPSAEFVLIHADLVPENVLHGGGGVKAIDFDDAGYGWRMFELATALFFHLDAPNYPAIEQALIAGYRSVHPLPDEEIARLPLFFFLRSLTYLGWVQSRPGTATARQMTPLFVTRASEMARRYIATAGG